MRYPEIPRTYTRREIIEKGLMGLGVLMTGGGFGGVWVAGNELSKAEEEVNRTYPVPSSAQLQEARKNLTEGDNLTSDQKEDSLVVLEQQAIHKKIRIEKTRGPRDVIDFGFAGSIFGTLVFCAGYMAHQSRKNP